MIEVKGKGGISAKIVAHSKSSVDGKEIVTYEVTHHRWILAEINKHRLFSNNYQSSRAVPVGKVLEQVRESPAMPIHWGAKQSGMQADNEVENWDSFGQGEYQWLGAMVHACDRADVMNDQGYHKQIVNRLTEPFQMIKGVITATELDNFFYLRRHPDAQPEIRELADCMWEALQQSEPQVLKPGEWHLPYVKTFRASYGDAGLEYHAERIGVTLHEALRISAASVAQVSFRKLDQSSEKVDKVWGMLVDTEQPHAVCLEHQATPMPEVQPKIYFNGRGDVEIKDYIPDGVTHLDLNGSAWSGNFKSFIQHRQLLDNNTCWKYEGGK